jgi:DNA-directed RNA polymerase specialized sigma24 family protein
MAISLRYLADTSVVETADTMRCRPGTVQALTHQAMNALRERLDVDSTEVAG